ncbi:tetratricopeptide repeat protein [Segetibacter koreensis]|uniref:tetratricopeptide repeat protein n=1 Tax=Segetibacter koreensis TaxID=398037 RepID=UPI0012F7E310|nr:tetratricopeptide repeat protein [Segetibacter koreensis]
MKKYFFVVFVFISSFCFAQSTQNADTLHATAKTFLQQGDYDNAVLVLKKALQIQPDDLQITKDLLFAYYLKRDFAKAMEVGKPLVERKDADVQSFQLLGLTYRAIAEDDEAEKLYKTGLKKFPDEGVLYSEYGELVADKKMDLAVKLWEKGVDADPNYSSNYFLLAKQYALSGNSLWSILYAEMFLNMESFTARSTEMKNLLLDQYKKYFVAGYVPPKITEKKNIDKKADKKFVQFTTAVAETLNKQQSQTSLGITPETLTVIRTRFILDWYNTYGDTYPFRLFEHQRQLLQEGMFEAYNFWLFGPAANLKAYQTWQQFHQQELNTFLTFIRSKVFKVPEGQQYYYIAAK